MSRKLAIEVAPWRFERRSRSAPRMVDRCANSGTGQPKRFVQRDLLGCVGEMIVAADHVRDLHQRVVNHDHVVVDRHPVRTQNDGIADDFVRELDVAVNDVVKADGMLGNPQPDGAGLAGRAARLASSGSIVRHLPE